MERRWCTQFFSSSSPPALIYSPVWFVGQNVGFTVMIGQITRQFQRFVTLDLKASKQHLLIIINLKAFIKINNQNSVFDKSRIAQNECHAFSPLPDLHNSLVTRLLKQQIASANKWRYQRAQITISKFLHFTVWVAHIHSHGHKFKNKSSHALEDTCNSITCRYTGKGCAQVNTQSPSLPLCHTRAHTLILWWVESFAVAVPEEESGSVCPKWLAYLCRKTDSFICVTLSRCFVVVSALI